MSTDRDLKPENVSETAAEMYLRSCGWWSAFDATQLDRDRGFWIKHEPVLDRSVMIRKTRAEAVLIEYRRDLARLAFVLNHAKTADVLAVAGKAVAIVAIDILKDFQTWSREAVLQRLSKKTSEDVN